MLLHINAKFTMGKLESFLLSQTVVLNCTSLSILRVRSRDEVDVSVSLIYFKCCFSSFVKTCSFLYYVFYLN